MRSVYRARRLSLFGLLAASAAAGQPASVDARIDRDTAAIASPTLRALVGARPARVDAFWRAVQARGAPLVEPLADDSTRRLVTFLFRSAKPVRAVLVADFGSSALRTTLRRIAGTDIWQLSTRVPDDARFLYHFAIDDPHYPFELDDSLPYPRPTQRDSLNPRVWRRGALALSLVVMPRAAPTPWDSLGATPRGVTTRFTTPFHSAVLGNDRSIFLHKPPGYADSLGPYPLLVFGASYLSQIRLPAILDHLVATKRIAPVVAVFFDWPAGQQDRESGCLPQFGDFLATELLPWVRERVRVTSDPSLTAVGGASAGALSAACVGFAHPEAFGNVVSESGAFWRGFGETETWWDDPARDDAERVWFPREVARAPRVPVRFFLSVGVLESGGTGRYGRISMVHANRQLRDVLVAKGYDVRYREISGGHDPYNWEAALVPALEAMFGRAR